MRQSFFVFLLLIGVVGGSVCGEWVCRVPTCRDLIGVLCGRGHLLASAGAEAVYQADLERAVSQSRFAAGIDDKAPFERTEVHAVLDLLVATAMARSLAAHEKVSRAEIEREVYLVRRQFRDEKSWAAALQRSGLSTRAIGREVAASLRMRQWIAGKIARDVRVTPAECLAFYNAHPQSFAQPLRLRAGHLFLAAPAETPPLAADAKRKLVESLSLRLAHGENLSDLVAASSEDEATKKRGGDLGYFSAFRMPADFFAATTKLDMRQSSPPIQTRLGFHIVQLTDSEPVQQLPFDQARAEIAAALESEQRQHAVEALIVDLCTRAKWFGAARP